MSPFSLGKRNPLLLLRLGTWNLQLSSGIIIIFYIDACTDAPPTPNSHETSTGDRHRDQHAQFTMPT